MFLDKMEIIDLLNPSFISLMQFFVESFFFAEVFTEEIRLIDFAPFIWGDLLLAYGACKILYDKLLFPSDTTTQYYLKDVRGIQK